MNNLTKRIEILKTGIDLTTGDRQASYGSFYENLTALSELKALYDKYALGKYSGQHDQAIHYALTKLSRIMCGKYKEDNYVDLAVYIAAAAEAESQTLMPF